MFCDDCGTVLSPPKDTDSLGVCVNCKKRELAASEEQLLVENASEVRA
ncbi:MAG: hypothetical protein ACW98F_04665 [Candidatus Hodarchaeales archaeon]|jgi:DNA-directed RNA polymerase subunit M/transcription elongation factor TFIIS